MFLSPQQSLCFGLDYLGLRNKIDRWSEKTKLTKFHSNYGSTPLDLAEIWYDMMNDDKLLKDNLELTKKDKSEKGFKAFMLAHYFMWVYPKNAQILSASMGVSEYKSRGIHIWIWVRRIARMSNKKIRWDIIDNDDDFEILAVTTDGVYFYLYEKQHLSLPQDNAGCSFKIKHFAAKYDIALSTKYSKIVHFSGPYKGGVHDLEMFRRGGLRDKLKEVNNKMHQGKKK